MLLQSFSQYCILGCHVVYSGRSAPTFRIRVTEGPNQRGSCRNPSSVTSLEVAASRRGSLYLMPPDRLCDSIFYSEDGMYLQNVGENILDVVTLWNVVLFIATASRTLYATIYSYCYLNTNSPANFIVSQIKLAHSLIPY